MRTLKIWLLSLTWGLPITLAGLIVALALLITGHKPKRFHHFIYFEVGKHWGGFSLGTVFVLNKNPAESTMRHEAGHSIQNTRFGFLMPFLVSIPSAIRYWYRNFIIWRGLGHTLPSYYSIWFERQATELGDKYFT